MVFVGEAPQKQMIRIFLILKPMPRIASQHVPVKECYLTNEETNAVANKTNKQKAFIWPKSAIGNEFVCVNLEIVTDVVKFLSAFDSVFHSDKRFQYRWGISDENKNYRSVYKNLRGEPICEVQYFDVCRFLIKLDQHARQTIFYEIQAKFYRYDTIRNISYTDFSRVFAFLTYMTVFLQQWERNLLPAFSLEFKFIENEKMNNVLFSNKEYTNINQVCKWYYPIYFKFSTMSPVALKKFVDIYNLYKNKPPSCIYKNMYNLYDATSSDDEMNDIELDEIKHNEIKPNEIKTNEIKTNEIKTNNSCMKTRKEILSQNWLELSNNKSEIGDDFDPNSNDDPCNYLVNYSTVSKEIDVSYKVQNTVQQTTQDDKKDEISKIIMPLKVRIKNPKSDNNKNALKRTKLEMLEENFEDLDKKNEVASLLTQFNKLEKSK